jgi:molecular chaperone GrpE
MTERVENNRVDTSEPDAALEQLKSDLLREQDMHLRALADFDNYRRRVERDRARTAATARRDILLPLLEVVDNFDRALPYLQSAPASVAEGMQAIHRRLLELLDANKVRSIPTVGQPFDPAVHEAIAADEGGEHPAGTVTEELQRGYRMGDELLRPARVRVAR